MAVEEYSDELLPRPVALTSHEAAPPPSAGRRAAATGSGYSASSWPRSPASGSREDGWGCARTGVNSGMANGRLTDRTGSLWSRIKRVALTDVGALMRGLNADDLENLERVLIEADFGVPATVELTQALEDEVRRGKLKTEGDLRTALELRLTAMLNGRADPGTIARAESGPTVVMMVGVNGTGKTTTAAKLARQLQREGRKVLLAAADTYRAGAIARCRSGPTASAFRASPGSPAAIQPRWRSMPSTRPVPAVWIPLSWTRRAGSTPRKA